VLFFENERIEACVRKLVRRKTYRISFDYAFADVMEACARPRAGKVPLTWLTPRMMDAYLEMYRAGYAHSIEVWDSKERLVGGIYGVAIGDVFFGESQFSTVSNASKLASAALNSHLRRWGFAFRDTRWMTEHHRRAGCVTVHRAEFNALVRAHVDRPSRTELWEVDRQAMELLCDARR
jgi:leucyl/phenylalanyl-tRNA--protein transferase